MIFKRNYLNFLSNCLKKTFLMVYPQKKSFSNKLAVYVNEKLVVFKRYIGIDFSKKIHSNFLINIY